MSLNLKTRTPTLPVEIWRIILSISCKHTCYKDLLHLWTQLRCVSRLFKMEIESLLLTYDIRGAGVWIAPGKRRIKIGQNYSRTVIDPRPRLCFRFSQLSEDGNEAVFKATFDDFNGSSMKESDVEQRSAWFDELYQTRFYPKKLYPAAEMHGGYDYGNVHLSECIHYAPNEQPGNPDMTIELNWRQLYAFILSSENVCWATFYFKWRVEAETAIRLAIIHDAEPES